MSCNPDKVFVTFFDELNAPEILFRRLFSEYAYKGAVNAITSTFANDRRRDSDEVRQNLAPRIAMQLKDRVAIELRDFVHLDRLMG
jgi:hypothetical protein